MDLYTKITAINLILWGVLMFIDAYTIYGNIKWPERVRVVLQYWGAATCLSVPVWAIYQLLVVF